VLFWQKSALDLESIDIKFYFTCSICWGLFVVVVFVLLTVFVVVGVAFLTLLERRILGYVHIFKGPKRVRFVGIFQPFRDAITLFSRKQYFPFVSNYYIYYFSPIFGYFLSLLV
jgi:NADH:ubiquinone oxidoreductase subunit H